MNRSNWLEIPLAGDEGEWLLFNTPTQIEKKWHFRLIAPDVFIVLFESQSDMSRFTSQFDDIRIYKESKRRLQVKFVRHLTSISSIYSVASNLGIKIEIGMFTLISGMTPDYLIISNSIKRIDTTGEYCRDMLNNFNGIPSGRWIDAVGNIPNSFHVQFQNQKDITAFLMGLDDHSSILKKYKRKLEIKFARITSDVANMRETADRLDIEIKFKTHLRFMIW